MGDTKRSYRAGPWLACLVLVAWAVSRTLPTADVVFSRPDRPVLLGVDPLFHARHARISADNFPHVLRRDPASHYPSVEFADAAGLYNVAIAAAAIAGSGGRPDPAFVETVAAWSPVAISTVSLAGMMLLTALLAGHRAALLAGLLALAYPGAVGTRSLLGYADQHVAEFTLLVWAAVAAVAAARRAQTAPALVLARRGLGYGLPLAVLLYTWLGAPLYVALFGAAAAGAFVVALADQDHARAWAKGLATIFLAFGAWQVLVRTFWPELAVEFLPGVAGHVLAATFAAPVLLVGTVHAFRRLPPRGPRRTLLAALAGVSCVAASAWLVFGTEQGASYWSWATAARGADVAEQQAAGLRDLWVLYGPVYPLGVLGFLACARSPERVSVTFVALFAGALTGTWLSAHDFEYAGPLLVFALAGPGLARFIRAVESPVSRFFALDRVKRTVLALAVTAAVVSPAFLPGSGVRPPWPGPVDVRDGTALDAAWYDAMTWLRDHSPVPTVSPFADPPVRDSLGYAPGTYGVMSPWDAGNAVSLVAERLPVASRYPTPADALWLGERNESASLRLLCPGCGRNEGTVYAAVDADRSGPGLITKLGLTGRPPRTVAFETGTPFGTLYRFDSTLVGSMAYRLYFEDGSGLEHYRLVRESAAAWYSALAFDRSLRTLEFASRPMPAESPVAWTEVPVRDPIVAQGSRVLFDHFVSPAVKVFRVVRGALLVGTASPGALVEARVSMRSGSTGRTVTWDRRTAADASGGYRLRIPYPSRADSSWTDLQPVEPVVLHVSSGGEPYRIVVHVSERDVANGTTVRVPDVPPADSDLRPSPK